MNHSYYFNRHLYPSIPPSPAPDYEQLLDKDVNPVKLQFTSEDATVGVVSRDRCRVTATINGIPRRAEFTSSQVVGALISEKLIPLARPFMHYKTGGPKMVTIKTSTGDWDAEVDMIAEEFGDEYADQVAVRLFTDHPEAWTWDPRW